MKLERLSDKAFEKVQSLLSEFFENPLYEDDTFHKKMENQKNVFGRNKQYLDFPDTVMFSTDGKYPIRENNSLIIEDTSYYRSLKDSIFDGYFAISFAMYGQANGDLMREPEFVIAVNEKEAIPMYLRVDWLINPQTSCNLELAPFPYWDGFIYEQLEKQIAETPNNNLMEEQKLITALANLFFITL